MIGLFNHKKELTIKNALSERDYYKNCIDYYKKESSNVGKLINLEEENEDLLETLGFLEYKVEELKGDNESLREENKKLNDICFKTTQENALMDKHIKENDYYNTYELDKNQVIDTLDKITEQRDTYKEVIKVMCDKYNISHESVLEIVDDISQNKGRGIERV